MNSKYDFSKHEDLNWGFDLKNYIQDLNTYFKIIDIPEYIERHDPFYIDKKVPVKELYFLLDKTPLERFTKYLLFAGWEYMEKPIVKMNEMQMQKVSNARLLLFLRENEKSKTDINISLFTNEKPKYNTKDENLINNIQYYLEDYFFEVFANEFQDHKKITNEKLKLYIENRINHRGAPKKNTRIA